MTDSDPKLDFDQIWAKWEYAKSRLPGPAVQMRRWKSAFESMSMARARMVQEGAWTSGPSDLLAVLGQHRRETFHCRVLAWLLDPVGKHGMGEIFLRGFLDACGFRIGLKPDGLMAVSVRTEVTALHSRADVVVKIGAQVVVIEAKIDAEEGPSQCDRLFQDFSVQGDAHFVFLTPDGRAPETASDIAKEAFFPLSFSAVRQLLTKNLDSASQDPLSHSSLVNYLGTLRRICR